jgi:hypothetical protein
MIANTRVVTVDARLSALSRQSVRLVHENPGQGTYWRALGCPDRLNARILSRDDKPETRRDIR